MAGADHAQVLVHRQRAPEPAALRHVADAEPGDLGRRAADELLAGKVIEPEAAGTRPMIALQSVVLPMPLRPTTDSDAAVEGEVDALQRVAGAVVDVEARDLEGGGADAAAFSHGAAPEIELLHLGIVLDLARAGPP